MNTGTFISYLADPTDPSMGTPWVDLNGYERGASPFETAHDTFDLGAPGLEGVWLSEDGKDEDVLSAHRRGRVESSFDLRLGPGAGDLAALTAQLRMLNAALDPPDGKGVWVLQQPSMPDPLFIDYYPSPLIQQLMPGQRSLYYLWSALQQPNGMRVTIVRHPKMRGFALQAALNLAHNGTLAEDHDHNGTPTFWSWSDPLTVLFPDEGFDWTAAAHEAYFETTSTLVFSQTSDASVVAAAGTYSFAMDVAAAFTTPPNVRARIDWLDAGAAVLSSTYGTPAAGLSTPLVGFVRPFVTGVAPTGTAAARYGIEVTPADTSGVQVWLRAAQFQLGEPTGFRPGRETVSNDATAAFGKRIWLWNTGNADALGDLVIDPSTTTTLAQVSYSRRSGARDSAMAMRYLPGWHAVNSSSLLNGSTDVTGESATVSGHAMKTAIVNDTLKPVLRHTVTVPEESSLRGTWALKAALRAELGDDYHVEARYGFGNVADLPRRAAPSPVDLNLIQAPTSSDYVVLDLGYVRVSGGTLSLYLELWAARVSGDPAAVGTGNLYVDQLWLEPADDKVNTVGSIPGVVVPSTTQTETIKGSALLTGAALNAAFPGPSYPVGHPFATGSLYNDEMLLNDTYEAASIPLAATAALSAVLHTYVVFVTMFTQLEKQAVKHGELRVHDLTSNTQIAAVWITNVKGAAWQTGNFTVRFTPVAGHAYVVYVLSMIPTTGGSIRIAKFTHSFVPPVVGATAQSVDIDASQRQARVMESGEVKGDLPLVGPFPTLMPRLQLYRVSFAGITSNGYDGALDGVTPLKHDPKATALVTVDSIPRWTN